MNSIMDFPDKVRGLRDRDKLAYSILERIYSYDSGVGFLVIPDSFQNKIIDYFAGRDDKGKITESAADVLARIQQQKIIKITNKWTGESTLFNSLRSKRPGIRVSDLEREKTHIHTLIRESKQSCDFCHPEKYTPEDVFGRMHGEYSITAANLAKYDVWSSLLIFYNHNPLKFSREELSDYINTSFAWFETVNNHSPEFRFPFLVWNCLPRAGASQVHGHCQILMSKQPYAGVETLHNTYQKYMNDTGNDYFQDLYLVHRSLGLSGKYNDICFFTSITPLKEKEVMIISPENPANNNNFKETIHRILRCFIDILGVNSFNLSLSCPPMDKKEELPHIIRIVDRGSPLNSSSDMGGMELYGSSVVADDPYKIMDVIKTIF